LVLSGAGACCTAPAAVDRFLPPDWRSAANPPAAVATVDRWDRRTDGQTDDNVALPALLLRAVLQKLDS